MAPPHSDSRTPGSRRAWHSLRYLGIGAYALVGPSVVEVGSPWVEVVLRWAAKVPLLLGAGWWVSLPRVGLSPPSVSWP